MKARRCEVTPPRNFLEGLRGSRDLKVSQAKVSLRKYFTDKPSLKLQATSSEE
jgi:hypothetical protein